MRNCGKLMDIWLTPSGVRASQMLVSQQISCISLAVAWASHKSAQPLARASQQKTQHADHTTRTTTRLHSTHSTAHAPGHGIRQRSAVSGRRLRKPPRSGPARASEHHSRPHITIHSTACTGGPNSRPRPRARHHTRGGATRGRGPSPAPKDEQTQAARQRQSQI